MNILNIIFEHLGNEAVRSVTSVSPPRWLPPSVPLPPPCDHLPHLCLSFPRLHLLHGSRWTSRAKEPWKRHFCSTSVFLHAHFLSFLSGMLAVNTRLIILFSEDPQCFCFSQLITLGLFSLEKYTFEKATGTKKTLRTAAFGKDSDSDSDSE